MDIFEDFDLINDPDMELVEDGDPNREYVIRPRIDHFTHWNDSEFFNRFRLSKPTVEFILQNIVEEIQNPTNRYVLN